MSEVFLGLDVGTQGTKALLVDVERGIVLARASASYAVARDAASGAAEQHPSAWIEAIAACMRALRESRSDEVARIAGIGVSGQQHGLVLVDAQGSVVRASKLWCDTSTAGEADALSQALGRRVPVGYTASKVAWTIAREPETWQRAATAMLPHDYVNFVLTGERVCEAGDASGTGYFDPVARSWDARALREIGGGLAAKLPRLVASRERAGVVTPAAAARFGVRAGTPVSSGGGDNMASAIGAGAVRDGVFVASLGTSATLFTRSERAIVDPAGLVAPFCDATGAWLPLLCTMNCTAPADEVRAAFGAVRAELEEDASRVAPGCGGLLWLTFLAGERVPDLPRASGALVGQRAGWLDRGRLYRAAIEGAVLTLAWGLERMRALELAPRELHAVGGAAQSDLWLAVLASALDVRVVALEESESAALGAALQAAWCVRGEPLEPLVARCVRTSERVFEPEPVARAAYADALERFRETAARLFDAG